jgi:hypothetical protein
MIRAGSSRIGIVADRVVRSASKRRQDVLNLEPRRPSFGTVLGAIGAVCGFVSLSGLAVARPAATQIGRGDIAPGAVTAKTLARGAVGSRALAGSAVTGSKLAKGAVGRRSLANNAVTTAALAEDAVTKRALAPGSVYGGALGEQTIHTTRVADVDEVAANPQWTSGNSEAALCGAGERLMMMGYETPKAGDKELTWLKLKPLLTAPSIGAQAEFASNTGGSAEGVVISVCLK